MIQWIHVPTWKEILIIIDWHWENSELNIETEQNHLTEKGKETSRSIAKIKAKLQLDNPKKLQYIT